ncbi:MAG: hypothetical protein SO096_05690 [Prevotella sp.]|nr:hypothetical protein [Bacteroidales bacterium]MDY4955941.1 hypothetical protein [Prevotella sp.]
MSSILDKYNKVLDDKQKQLADYINSHLTDIDMPEPSAIPAKPKTTTNYSVPIAVAGGGILVAGLAFDKTLLAVLGGLALVGGVCAKVLMGRTEKQAPPTPEPKYYLLTKKVYDAASAIQQHLFDEWKSTLSDNKDKLKAEIGALDVNDQKKNAAIQAILTTSVIDIPMMTVSSELSAVEKQKSVDAYHQYLQVFKKRCADALDKAVAEQKDIYVRLDGVI